MRVCILGSGLTALTLAKALVNQNIFVDLVSLNKRNKINQSRTIGISKSNYQYVNRSIINIGSDFNYIYLDVGSTFLILKLSISIQFTSNFKR